ncbi:hypothetical protein [Bradyrhizobium sp.]|nr:hypothetical protein [Bradyrhizobium sp.]
MPTRPAHMYRPASLGGDALLLALQTILAAITMTVVIALVV